MRLGYLGAVTFSLGLLLLGAISLASGQFVPGLQPVPDAFQMPGTVARLNGLLIATLSASILVKRFQGPAAALLAAYFSSWLFVAQLPQVLFETFDITHMVSLFELAAIVAVLTMLAFCKESRSTIPAKIGRIVYGGMLLLFAVVHFQYHAFIASMIPEWIPFAGLWPWFTASANMVVGISFLTGFRLKVSGILLGAMYASWIPIVHLPRVLSAPADVAEWIAGALAVALAGAAWLVAGAGEGRGPDPAAIATD